jgi:hypothetical protein
MVDRGVVGSQWLRRRAVVTRTASTVSGPWPIDLRVLNRANDKKYVAS